MEQQHTSQWEEERIHIAKGLVDKMGRIIGPSLQTIFNVFFLTHTWSASSQLKKKKNLAFKEEVLKFSNFGK